jgi:hypothetical protein
MKQKLIIITAIVLASPLLYSFCGFYVSKADATLKNKTSQVILVRDGNRNVITMYNDFKGDTKDFAMVVPVPVVLQKSAVKVIDQALFKRLNDYSAPRLVEYYDSNPCEIYKEDRAMAAAADSHLSEVVVTGYGNAKKYKSVTVEAQYIVGEYDIIMLSAKESTGLKNWLHDNGYKIPANAEEVLDPYIKSNLKFFVVKVNEAEKKKLPGNFLRPIQISFHSPKFMLPIRLGMANADGDQDLIVYAFTKTGRVECTNYRNVSIPTGNNIPLFVQKNFGSFHENLFSHQWQKENEAVSFLEYAWDVSPQNYVKCDPCIATAPGQQDLMQSGVNWLHQNWEDYSDAESNEDLTELSTKVHFTRLHFRYNRNSFPQDLMFQTTPNDASFQARYVITHPAMGNLSCAEGRQYLERLKARRKQELNNLTSLTGRNMHNWQQTALAAAENEVLAQAQYANLIPQAIQAAEQRDERQKSIWAFGALVLLSAGLLKWKQII